MKSYFRSLIFILSLIGHGSILCYAQDRLVMLSPHWEGIRYEMANAFSAQHLKQTGRTIEFASLDVGGTSDIVRFVRSEFKHNPQGIGVDIFFGGGVEAYEDFKQQGYLQAIDLDASILAPIAPSIAGVPLYDPEHYWFAPVMNAFGILCNLDVLKRMRIPQPSSFKDLSDRRFFSWLGAGDPRKSGSAHIAFEIILQAYGWENGWRVIHALAGNLKSFSTYSALVPQDIASGEIACGLSIDSYAWGQIREFGKEHISFSMTSDAPVVSGDALAVFKGAPNSELAKKFLAFTLSKNAQKIFMLPQGVADGPQRYTLNRLSVMPSLYAELAGKTNVFLNPFETKSAVKFDPHIGAKRYLLVNDLFGSLLIDPLRKYQQLWKKALRENTQEEFLNSISAMPLTEEQALELATSEQYRDPVRRQAIIARWRALADQRYAAAPSTALWIYALPSILLIGVLVLVRWRDRN